MRRQEQVSAALNSSRDDFRKHGLEVRGEVRVFSVGSADAQGFHAILEGRGLETQQVCALQVYLLVAPVGH